jgi:hypothetical protein
MPEQRNLETLYLAKDTDECWHTYCRECATKFGEEHQLTWNTYPFMPDTMETPNGVSRPADEEHEPLVYAPDTYESDTPASCEDCLVYLECDLTKDGVEYLTDEVNEFPKEVIALYLGE